MESIKFANEKHVLPENKPLYKLNDENMDTNLHDHTYV